MIPSIRRLECRNASDQAIVAVEATPHSSAPLARVVVVPGYEHRIQHHSVLSRYLTDAGCATVRFDLTDHVGLSDGEVLDYSVSSMVEDVQAVLEALDDDLTTIVVALSMGARAAVRALATGAPADALVMLLPVVDVRATWRRAIGWDPIADLESGRVTDLRTSHRILSHHVAYACAHDASTNALADLAGTRAEIAQLRCPVVAIAIEHDDWIDVADVESALAEPSDWRRQLIRLDASSHDVQHNPPILRLLMEALVREVRELLGSPVETVRHPSFDDVVATVRTERSWARRGYTQLTEEVEVR